MALEHAGKIVQVCMPTEVAMVVMADSPLIMGAVATGSVFQPQQLRSQHRKTICFPETMLLDSVAPIGNTDT